MSAAKASPAEPFDYMHGIQVQSFEGAVHVLIGVSELPSQKNYRGVILTGDNAAKLGRSLIKAGNHVRGQS